MAAGPDRFGMARGGMPEAGGLQSLEPVVERGTSDTTGTKSPPTCTPDGVAALPLMHSSDPSRFVSKPISHFAGTLSAFLCVLRARPSLPLLFVAQRAIVQKKVK